MKRVQSHQARGTQQRLTRTFLTLLACSLVTSHAFAGSITHYRMDNVLNRPDQFFTFSVDDVNDDGIGSHDEIRDFSGLLCDVAACPFPEFTVLGKVDRDFTFGGAGEAFLDLTTLNWTYNIIGGTFRFSGPTRTEVAPYNATLGADFGMSAEFDFGGGDIALLGSPFRLFVPGGPRIWAVTAVPEPGVLTLALLGLCGIALRHRRPRNSPVTG